MHQVFGNKKAIAVFVVPALILYILVGFFPILQSMYYSLLDWDGIQPAKFIGLASYKDLFFADTYGMDFNHSILNTLYLAVLSVFMQLPIALVLALVLARGCGVKSCIVLCISFQSWYPPLSSGLCF